MIVITEKLEERKQIFNHNTSLMRKILSSEIVPDTKDFQVLPILGYYTNGIHL